MPVDHPAAGLLVGRFRLVHWIGSGGTGDVWLAEDEVLGRRVAVKLPHPDLVRDERVRREFLREARAGSMLEHPGIATVYDVGDSTCGPFIAMAYIDGPSLREIVREAPIPLDEAVSLIAAAADALAHAHARELVHGDLSPGNLMIDGNGHIKIVDFGLARSLAPGIETTRSQVLGTYPYMAPEVLRGGAPDLRSDLYGLGVVLYQLVTGELPYEGRTPGAYVAAVLEGRVRDPRALNGAISPTVCALLRQAIARDPAERPAGGADLARRLRGVIVGKAPPTAHREGASPATTTRRRGDMARPRPLDPAESVPPATSSATRTLIEARLLQAHAFLRRPDQDAAMDAALRALESLRSLDPTDPRVLGALARASLFKGQLTRDSAWEDRAAEHVRLALDVGPEHPDTLLAAADLDRVQGRHEQALERYAAVLAMVPRSVEAHVGASWAHERRGDLARAEASARAAIESDAADWRGHSRLAGHLLNRGAFARALEPWRRVVEIAPDHARGWSSYGSVLFEMERFEDALAAFERSIALQPTTVGCLNAGTTLYYLGRYAEAVAQYERAIALNPSDARAWGNLGSACRSIPGQDDRASDALDRAVVLMREHLDRHDDDATGWSWLAFWLAQSGRREEAERARDRALELAPERLHTLPVMAGTFELLGDDSTAIRIYCERIRNGSGLRTLNSDPALARLRATPEWQHVLAAVRERAETPPPGDAPYPQGGIA